jgi:hypothetical protein
LDASVLVELLVSTRELSALYEPFAASPPAAVPVLVVVVE